jgi:hypothetical protein
MAAGGVSGLGVGSGSSNAAASAAASAASAALPPPPPQSFSQRVNVGCFTIYPATGLIAVGGTTKINIEADPQRLGLDEVTVMVHVDGRTPVDHPLGLPLVSGLNVFFIVDI